MSTNKVIASLFVLAATPAFGQIVAPEGLHESQGTFTDDIAIDVPDFRGIEPHLALRYTSAGGDGNVGVGWSLDGFSTIQRVNWRKTAPQWNASDRYLLDGEPL